jgi:hypothetical protein
MPVNIRRGTKTGTPGRRRANFDQEVRALAPLISNFRAAGILRIRDLVAYLNENNVRAPSGKKFSFGTLRRVLRRLEELQLGEGPRSLSRAASERAARPYTFRRSKAARATDLADFFARSCREPRL